MEPHESQVQVERGHIRVWRWGDPGSPGCVLLHGLAHHGRVWDDLACELAGLGFCVFAPDMRGHGGSSCVSDGYSVMSLTSDLETVVASIGADGAQVVAHSFGGIVAARAAARRKVDLELLAMAEVGPQMDPNALVHMETALRPTFATIGELEGHVSMMHPLSADAPVERLARFGHRLEHGRYGLATDPQFVARFGTIDFGATNDRIWEILCDSPPPQALFYGEVSSFLGAGEQEAVGETLGCDTIVTIPSAGHCVHLDNPDFFNSQIVDLLV